MAIDVATGIAAAKLAFDALHKLSDVLNQKKPDLAAIKTHVRQLEQTVLQFQQTVYELQKGNLELQAQNNQLQAQLDTEKRWERIRNRYELKEVYPGTRLYVPRDGNSRRLCQRCFEHDHKEMTLQGGANESYLHCVSTSCRQSYQIAPVPSDPPRRAKTGSWMAS